MADQRLIEELKAAAATLFDGTGILAAYAFGSRIAGRPRPDSDLDVGYFLRRAPGASPIPLREELQLADALSQALGVDVDLRDLGAAPLELRGRAMVEGVRVYSGIAVERVALERELLARYHDYRVKFRNMHEIRLRRMAGTGAP
jgi:predicted nucleotidyltransferase